jgi:hypothetical protein
MHVPAMTRRAAMKVTVLLAAVGCLLSYPAGAQETRFDFGSTLNVTLSDTLDAKKSKVGDAVNAKVTEDLKAGGAVIIPKGSRLTGHVTQAQPVGDAGSKASLGLTFEHAELKDGHQIPLQTGLFALASPEGVSNGGGSSSSGAGFNSGGFGGGSANSGSLVSNAGHAATDDTSALGGGSRRIEEELKSSPGAVGGINGKGTLYASSRGVFGMEGVTLQPGAMPGGASTMVVSTGRTVHLPSGTRMLLAVESGSPER